ncbi:MAG: helix-turn-helix domain-containing protein [Lachnospiraceae bacterium]|nr:helix-turn-helix domain-containing protein [Lachnospiraceae bacterium]
MEKTAKRDKEGIQLTIIEKIEALMDENKINQATLAREIDIGPAQLSKCLNRKGNNYVSIDALIRISDYFKVPVDHLLGRSTLRIADKAQSNAQICRELVDLIETNTVNIINASVEEETLQPDEDDPKKKRREKKKSTYKMFYFSNYLPLSKMKETDTGMYHPKRIEINAFIEYYLKLRDLYKKDDLPRAFFEQAIEDRLNQMRY